jgi:Flp pilus assembly protein TadG
MELLLNLPIWLIVLAGIIEVGEVLSAAQQVSLGARVGAEEASRAEGLPSAGGVPHDVVEAVARPLAAAGMSPTTIILEHNAGGAHATLISGAGPGHPPATPLPSQGVYVRVTVCARMNRLVPKMFSALGLDFSTQRLRDSVAFRYAGGAAEME